MKKKYFRQSIFISSLLLVIFIPTLSFASTTVSSSTISVDTYWTKADGPYLVQNPIYVDASATLSIAPGTVVKFSFGAGLTIAGDLQAAGLSKDPVYFTSINDRSVGGKTGTGNPTFTDWGGISFKNSPISFVLKNAEIRYSGAGISLNQSLGDFQNIILASSSQGVSVQNGRLTIENSQFQNISNPAFNVFATSTIKISSSTFNSMIGPVLQVFNNSDLIISSSSISNIQNGGALDIFNQSRGDIENINIQNIDSPSEALTVFNDSKLVVNDSLIQNATSTAAISAYNDRLPDTGLWLSNSILDRGYGDGLMIFSNTSANISGVKIQNFRRNGIEEFSEGKVYVDKTLIVDDHTGLTFDDPTLTISNSSVGPNNNGLIYNGLPSLNAQNVWWGEVSGPFNQNSNPLGTGNSITDNVIFNPWLSSDPLSGEATSTLATTTGSNVIFLPGLEGSRLYNQGLIFENQLWEPNRNADVDKLHLDEEGQSIDPSIYTRDIINKTNIGFGIFDKDIYQKFSDSMNALVNNGTINNWEAIPYDWRKDYNDLIVNGIKLANNQYISLPDEVAKMASSSRTHKVTIVTHSNGGLLAKALISYLQKKNRADLIDKLIMIAPPDFGTPVAVSGLLHGDELTLPIGLSKDTARTLGENMISAYDLLPSQKYFNNVNNPIVQFDPSIDSLDNFRKLYGNSINNLSTLSDFLLAAKDGRPKPPQTDVNDPNVLNSSLLTNAAKFHSTFDNWQAPAGISVTSVAGWGISTTDGLKYFKDENCLLGILPCSDTLGHDLLKTVDGDGTVVTPSVDKTNKLYINLHDYNADNKKNVSHATILESGPVEDLIKNLIMGSSSLPQYISLSKPSSINSPNLEIKSNGPISMNAYDSSGNHTGPASISSSSSDLTLVDENIPNSSYEETTEGQDISVASGDYQIKLAGLGMGSITLDEKVNNGDTQLSENVFADIPITPMTTAELSLGSNILATSSVLSIDEDGDGVVDATMTPSMEIDPSYYLLLMKKIVSGLDINTALKNKILNKIDDLLKLISGGKVKNATKKIKAFNNLLEEKMNKKGKHGKISKEDAQSLIDLLNQLLDSLNQNT